MNKAISIGLVFVLLFSCLSVRGSSYELYVSASSACLIIGNTGEVLFEKNAHTKRGIASTTKIMTSLVALENCDLYRKTIVKKTDVMVEGTSIGLKADDSIDLITLVKGMLLESGNDAANATATFVAGGKKEFALLMNKKAKELNMLNSSFKNPSGLTEEGHYSTAYDMAILSAFAIQNEQFLRISRSSSYTVSYGTPEYCRTFYNHNRFLNMYDGAIGIKTGFTKASGRCLVTAVERDGVSLVCVTLNAPDDWNDHKKLMDYGFSVIKNKEISLKQNELLVSVVNSEKKNICLESTEKLNIPYSKKISDYTVNYCIPPFIYGGVSKGQYVGWVELLSEEGLCIDKIYLTSREKANNLKKNVKNEEDKSLFYKIFK